MTGRILVAGVGNIFLRDDGFGVEVVRHLLARTVPDGVEVSDFGIRGVHLAYQLMDGYDTLVLVDAVPRDFEPGTVFVLEPDITKPCPEAEEAVESGAAPLVDAHGMAPGSMLAVLDMLGGRVRRVLVVGCQPGDVSEGIGLTPAVEAAIPRAVDMVLEVISEEVASLAGTRSRKE
jgi:hydrogenase maturation protease